PPPRSRSHPELCYHHPGLCPAVHYPGPGDCCLYQSLVETWREWQADWQRQPLLETSEALSGRFNRVTVEIRGLDRNADPTRIRPSSNYEGMARQRRPRALSSDEPARACVVIHRRDR